MRTTITLFTVLATTSIAAAEPAAVSHDKPRKASYVTVGAEAGVQRELMSGGFVDAGTRLWDSPLFLRGRVAAGVSGGSGSYQQLLVGVEGRGCVARDWICGFVGVDAGYQHDKLVGEGIFTPEMTYEDNNDLLAVPRAGIEVGKTVRARLAVEGLLRAEIDGTGTGNGAAASLGVGYTF